MKTTINALFLVLFLSLGMSNNGLCFSKNESKSDTSIFEVTFIQYNHAELLSRGITSYNLTSNYIVISKQSLFSEEDIIVFKAEIANNIMDRVQSIELWNLNEYYDNNCVHMASGDEYSISITVDTLIKKIHLHHYYHKKVEELVFEINSVVPNQYRINYVTEDTDQDCE